jgi:4-methyl-5(b-hydroxyethyl)-thiazole monophosphate biosynthesis
MIYVFLANGFEEMEALAPIDLLRRAERNVITVGVGGKVITGAHGIPVTADITTAEMILGGELEMIVLPGGMPGTLNLEKSEAVQAAVDFCMDRDIYIGAICAAPSILGHKGLLEGREAIAYPGFETQMPGAVLSDKSVCRSGNIVTAKGAGVATEFALQLVALAAGEPEAKRQRNAICYP